MASDPHGLERYEMNKIITKTLQGRLYRGRDTVNDVIVGVKEAFKVLVASGRSRDGSPVSEHFPTESRIHKEISQFPDMPRSILRMLDSWDTPDSFFVALEWAEGGEMFDYVKDAMTASQRDIASLSSKEQMPARELNEWQRAAKNIFKQLVEGVAYLHSKGYSHRDLSLENTLMANRENTRIKIIDFGVAQQYSDGNFKCKPGRVGKLGYMAPEVYAKQPYDARAADIWSLGVMLFMLLVGCPPYSTPRSGDQAFSFIFRGVLQFVLRHWKRLPMVPHEALDLLERIFKPEANRITMEEMWNHAFVQIPDPFPRFMPGVSRYESEEAVSLYQQMSVTETEEEFYKLERHVDETINRLTLQMEQEEKEIADEDEDADAVRISVVDRPSTVMGSTQPEPQTQNTLRELKDLKARLKERMSNFVSLFGRKREENT